MQELQLLQKLKVRLLDPKNFERLLVVGDLHGDFESFEKVCQYFDPSKDLLIFLGDYADRGPKGVEVVEGVDKLLKKYEGRVIALKGNHEDYRNSNPYFMPCDLIHEAETKRGGWKKYYEAFFKYFLEKLQLAALIQGKILLVHAGVSSRINSFEDLGRSELEENIFWSDPFSHEGEVPNPRGAGVLFGPDVSKKVCERLGVNFIVRSHEPRKALNEPYVEHEGRVVTISSTRVYGGVPFLLNLPARNLPVNGFETKKFKVSLL